VHGTNRDAPPRRLVVHEGKTVAANDLVEVTAAAVTGRPNALRLERPVAAGPSL